jgi:hypothetical protein
LHAAEEPERMDGMKEALEGIYTVLVAAVMLYLGYRFWKGLFTAHKSDTQPLFPKDRK